MLSNAPLPPSPTLTQPEGVTRLHQFIYDRCAPDFSPDAVSELYAFVSFFGGDPTAAVRIDPTRVYMAGSTADSRALLLPLIGAPPLLVRVPSAYRNPHASVAREAVVSLNIPPEERTAGMVNPAAASFLDAESLVVLAPQRSSSLTSYVREILARFRRTPPLVGGSHASPDAVPSSSSSHRPTASSYNGGDAATSWSPYAAVESEQQLLATLRLALESELGGTCGRMDTSGVPSWLELLLPVTSAGRRAHVPIVAEVNLRAPVPGGHVPPLRVRVNPPQGCELSTQVPGAPCDTQGYVARMDRAAATQALVELASRNTATAYLREIASLLGSGPFPYARATVPSGNPYGGTTTGGNPYAAMQSGNPYANRQQPLAAASDSDGVADVEPYTRPSQDDDDRRSMAAAKTSAPLPPPSGNDDDVTTPTCEPAPLPPAPQGDGTAAVEEAVPTHQQPPPAAAAPAAGAAEDTVADDNACVICLDAPRQYVCVPCGHRVLCEGCKANFPPGSQCPTCRGELQTTIKVFL